MVASLRCSCTPAQGPSRLLAAAVGAPPSRRLPSMERRRRGRGIKLKRESRFATAASRSSYALSTAVCRALLEREHRGRHSLLERWPAVRPRAASCCAELPRLSPSELLSQPKVVQAVARGSTRASGRCREK
jgi:hypothetical protein